MKKNIGKADRLIRLAISVVLFSLALWLKSWILLALGLFTLYEAAASWCIFYFITGKNSCTK